MSRFFHAIVALLFFASYFSFAAYGGEPDDVALFEPSGMVDGHEYVDLGLSVNWALCNVGADSVQSEGSEVAWAEITPNEEYDWVTYNFSRKSTSILTKYCLRAKQGRVDNLKALLPDDDLATMSWGDNWRTPTAQEYKELIDGCDWKWVSSYDSTGVPGVVGVSKWNDAMIFFPATDFVDDDDKDYFQGWYWTASLVAADNTLAQQFTFKKTGDDVKVALVKTPRCYGRLVRAVTAKIKGGEQ